MLNNKNYKILLPLLLVILMHGCIQTLDSLTFDQGAPIKVEFGSLNAEEIAQSVVGNFAYSIKGIPSDTSLGITEIRLTVLDGNGSSVNISIPIEIVNTKQPKIQLIGDSVITLPLNATWTDFGISMEDPVNGLTTFNSLELNQKQFVKGTVLFGTPGEYNLTYQASDELGNLSNVIVRTIIIKDFDGPVLEFTPSVTLFEGTPVSLDDIRVSDNIDLLTKDDLNVLWNGLNQLNPMVGEYQVTIQATDSSNNRTEKQRTYIVIYPVERLFVVLDDLARRNQVLRISELLSEYQNYPQIDQSRFLQSRRLFLSKHQSTYLSQYNSIKETQSIENAAAFLKLNSIFFEISFVNDEIFRLVSSNINRLSDEKAWEQALLVADQYRDDLSTNHYERFITITLSSMVRASNSNNAEANRRLLEQYAEAIGGMESTIYVNNSSLISELVFLDLWNKGATREATRSMSSDRDNGYISATLADELVRSEMRKTISSMHRNDSRREQLTNYGSSIIYNFTTIGNNWYFSYINTLFDS